MQGHVCDAQLMSARQCIYHSARILSRLLSNFSLHAISIKGLYNGFENGDCCGGRFCGVRNLKWMLWSNVHDIIEIEQSFLY